MVPFVHSDTEVNQDRAAQENLARLRESMSDAGKRLLAAISKDEGVESAAGIYVEAVRRYRHAISAALDLPATNHPAAD